MNDVKRFAATALLVAACGSSNNATVDSAPTADAGVDATPADAAQPAPTATDIHFHVDGTLTSGQWIVYNNWNVDPNTLLAVSPDAPAATATKVFDANRVWSMGLTPDGSHIAFSAFDEDQTAHFGVTFGDSIQNTFLFTPATQTLRALQWGNINDECHHFDASQSNIYVCRRYDFQADGSSLGYRLGVINVASGTFTFLSPLSSTEYALTPIPVGPSDGPATSLYYDERDVPPASGARIRKIDLTTMANTVVLDNASQPSLAPDGHHLLFANLTDHSAYYVIDLAIADAEPVKVTDTAGPTDGVWSPDGTTIAYDVYDDAHQCSHLETTLSDGSTAASPTRVRDCTVTNEFITQLAWITVP